MDFIRYDRAWIEKWTTLEVALQAYNKDQFIGFKREILKSEFDEEAQLSVWKNYHDLLYKAAFKTFSKSDGKRLEYYRQFGNIQALPDEIQLFHPNEFFFPTTFTRDDSGKIVRVTLNFVDYEVTRRWFDHIDDISKGLVDVRVCASCSNLFLRKRRKDVRFCGNTCRNRVWRKGKKKL